MKRYAAYIIAALTFYTWGILLISGGSAETGCAFVALGCVFFALALVRRKKAGKGD